MFIGRTRELEFYYRQVRLYLFAKNGFTSGCMEKADQMGNVSLIAYKDMLEK